MTDINIVETIEDKKSWFNIKRFKIGNVDFQKPEKSLDIKSIDRLTYRSIKTGFQFYEGTKVIRNFDSVLKIYYAEDEQISKFFYKGEWLNTAQNVVNLTFQFNPYNHVRSMDNLSWFFHHYYPYSKLFMTVPNIRTKRLVKVGKSTKTEQIIDLAGYEKFVDETYKILNDKNNKPIFVPISMKFNTRELTELIDHYLKLDRYNYWFDFEGRSINENSLGRLRHTFTTLKERGRFKNIVVYFSNVKREKTANSNEDTSVSSDVLSAVAGANLIGVNREPLPPPPKIDSNGKKIEPPPVDPSHKARIFDNDTYYYFKTKDKNLFDKKKYDTINAAKLNAEFTTQSEYFLEHNEIESLLNQKSMFKDEKAGNILHDLTSRSSRTFADMSDFF
jgi:hypothetical protein